MTGTVRLVSCTVTFAGNVLADVLSARGQIVADSGWPTCSVFVTAKPAVGGEDDPITVVAGAGNNVVRFTGVVRSFRTSVFPRAIELVCLGTLAYAAEWAPNEDELFDETHPTGATDQDLVAEALDRVVRLGSGGYTLADIGGTGITLGLSAPQAFDWRAGVTAWQRIQALDRATLYRTYQTRDGSIRRVQMIGHPHSGTEDFTLGPADVLDGATGGRETERTRNAVIVHGYDYGKGQGPALGTAYGNFGPWDGSNPAEQFPEVFESELIEDGSDPDGGPLGESGLNADTVASSILPDVLKEFVEATVPSWRDDTHGPGQTCLLDMLDRLAIGEPMWVAGYSWEVGDNGWQATYWLTGGGLEQSYTPPPT